MASPFFIGDELHFGVKSKGNELHRRDELHNEAKSHAHRVSYAQSDSSSYNIDIKTMPKRRMHLIILNKYRQKIQFSLDYLASTFIKVYTK